MPTLPQEPRSILIDRLSFVLFVSFVVLSSSYPRRRKADTVHFGRKLIPSPFHAFLEIVRRHRYQ